jgi:hypothetical protein
MNTPPPETPPSTVPADESTTLNVSQENEEVTSTPSLDPTSSTSATPLVSQESPQSRASNLQSSVSTTAAESSSSASSSTSEPAVDQIRNEDLPKLEDNQEEVMTSQLLDPIKM